MALGGLLKWTKDMKLLGVMWSNTVNQLFVKCNCGKHLQRPSSTSVVTCHVCGHYELWHGVNNGTITEGLWSLTVMEQPNKPRVPKPEINITRPELMFWPDGSRMFPEGA